MTGEEVIRSAFSRIVDLPCWQAVGEFGTYLSLHFGAPRVIVDEPTEALGFRRRASAAGQYVLRVEANQWVAFQDGTRVAESESPREIIRRAAANLQGQKLHGLVLGSAPAGGEFHFDLGGRIAYQRLDATDEDELWTLRACLGPNPNEVHILSFVATGKLTVVEPS